MPHPGQEVMDEGAGAVLHHLIEEVHQAAAAGAEGEGAVLCARLEVCSLRHEHVHEGRAGPVRILSWLPRR